MQGHLDESRGTAEVKIEVIDEFSPHLLTVIELGDANNETLGFLAKMAFVEHAKRGNIFVAVDSQGVCVGYLLYRYAKRYKRHSLVHLCVAPSHRGKEVSKLLVDYLKQIAKESGGIGLYCRRDFNLTKMWARLGFVAQHDKPGRSKDGKPLTYWWFQGYELFSLAPVQKLEATLCAVIDTQIFFELSTGTDNCFAESKSLFADWLQPELELCVTDEIFNKINSIEQEKERILQYEFARKKFTRLPTPDNFDTVLQSLNRFFYEKRTTIDEFESRNLARTIVSDAQVFVTLNPILLELSIELYDRFRLSVFRPNNLIVQTEEIRRELDYQPVRLAGSTELETIPVQKGQLDLLSHYFQCEKQGETKANFQQMLRRFLAEPDKFECLVVREGQNKLLALVVYGRLKKHELEISMFRVGNNPLSTPLARHLIFQSVSRSAREGYQFSRITDSYLEEAVTKAIHEDTFVQVNNGFLKANLAVAETASELGERLTQLSSSLGQEYNFLFQIAVNLNTETLITDVQASADIERFLWPAKIINAEIPTFIIPIQPIWAADLFDEKLANQTLLGRKHELAFNREAIFYRTVKNSRGLAAPSRIFWYVSGTQKAGKGKGYYEIQSVRACSYVNEVVIGTPKELHQIFQRLGVYNLTNISKINQDKNGNIMGIIFSETELFTAPVTIQKVEAILGSKLSVYSPCKIPPDVFAKVYNLGVAL